MIENIYFIKSGVLFLRKKHFIYIKPNNIMEIQRFITSNQLIVIDKGHSENIDNVHKNK